MNAAHLPRIAAPALLEAPAAQGRSKGAFADLLRQGLERLERLDAEADQQVRKLYSGEPVELHRVVLAGEEAGLAFELLMSVRNKVVDAYQEIMRMQV